MSCRSEMTVRITDEMRAFSRSFARQAPLPEWVEPAIRQHAEYAANDYCTQRGLAGLGAPIETTLPSVRAAEAYWLDEPGSTGLVIGSTLWRATLIAAGLLAVGQRKGVVRGALAGATFIEAFVLWTVRKQLQDAGRLARSEQRR